MLDNFNIERTVLASLLNSEMDIEFNEACFLDPFHRKLAKGINRLKELEEFVDFEILRNRFIKANKWTIEEDNMLIDIMTNTTPFSTQKIFSEYCKILEKSFLENLDRRIAI